jgi:hypothetical protein
VEHGKKKSYARSVEVATYVSMAGRVVAKELGIYEHGRKK